MSNVEPSVAGTKPSSNAWQSAVTVVQEATPPSIPASAHAMTIRVDFPAGDPGTPPHRHPGPAFGYVLDGEMLFELEGQPPRVIRAGEAFWEPGGDVIHYSDGNNRDDIPLRFLVTMLCDPGRPMLVLVGEDELVARRGRRVSRSPGFAADIRPLFREKDRNAMFGLFDLWNVEDVRRHAERIYGALAGNAMPCDGSWPEADMALLRRWIDEGAQP